jgi:peptide-methionine (R)-S-oxide reductase
MPLNPFYYWLMSFKSPAHDGRKRPDGTSYDVIKLEEEWKAELTPAEYEVIRLAGTEPPFIGQYTDFHEVGTYNCRACGFELFKSDTKFDSHCGWPSFFAPLAQDRVVYLEDKSLGSVRTEVRCSACGAHLGHVFEGEGYHTPTDLRYCINSISVAFAPEE